MYSCNSSRSTLKSTCILFSLSVITVFAFAGPNLVGQSRSNSKSEKDPLTALVNAVREPFLTFAGQPVEKLDQALDLRLKNLLEKSGQVKSPFDQAIALQILDWFPKDRDFPKLDDTYLKAWNALFEQFHAAIGERLKKAGPDQLAAIHFLSGLELDRKSEAVWFRARLVDFLPQLQELVKSPDAKIRAAALEAIGNIATDPNVLVSVLSKFQNEPSSLPERLVVVKAIGRILSEDSGLGSKTSESEIPAPQLTSLFLPLVMVALGDSDDEVRELAAQSFASITTKFTDYFSEVSKKFLEKTISKNKNLAELTENEIKDLRAQLERWENEIRVMQDVISKVFKNKENIVNNAIVDKNQRVRIDVLRGIEEIGILPSRIEQRDSLVKIFMPLLAGGNEPPPVPMEEKGKSPAEPVIAVLRSFSRALEKATKSPDDKTRLAAIEAIEAQGEDGASFANTLVPRLSDKNGFVRWAAARSLGNISQSLGNEALSGLTKMISEPRSDLDIRTAAIFAIRRFGDTQLQAKNPIDPQVINDAVRALAVATGQGYPYYVVDGVYHGDFKVRLNAIRALDAIGEASAPAIPDLALSLKDPDMEVRQTAAMALGRFGKKAYSAKQALEEALNDPEPEVRRNVNEALLRIQEK